MTNMEALRSELVELQKKQQRNVQAAGTLVRELGAPRVIAFTLAGVEAVIAFASLRRRD